MRVALLGMGTIGAGVFEQAAAIPQIEIVRVLDRRDIPQARGILTKDFGCIENDGGIDTVVELMGGERPAFDFAVRSLRKGKNFVSANKLMISHRLSELQAAAKEGKGALLYSAAVGGGIPFLRNILRAKRSDTILCVEGIVNGTTNFMLDAMSAGGLGYQASLRRAQDMGYAEADPTSDVEGYDASYKAAICASLAFGGFFSPDDVIREGITSIGEEDIANFKSMGMCARFVVHAVPEGGRVSVWAGPELVEGGSPYASVRSNYNCIRYTGKACGPMAFIGQGAGRGPTAAAVIADLLDISAGAPSMFTVGENPLPAGTGPQAAYYVRCGEMPGFASRAIGRGAWITRPVTPAFMRDYAQKLRGEGKDIAYAMLPNGGK